MDGEWKLDWMGRCRMEGMCLAGYRDGGRWEVGAEWVAGGLNWLDKVTDNGGGGTR